MCLFQNVIELESYSTYPFQIDFFHFPPYLFHGLIAHFFFLLNNIPSSGCTGLFIHLSAKGHLGCFQVLAIMRGHRRAALISTTLPHLYSTGTQHDFQNLMPFPRCRVLCTPWDRLRFTETSSRMDTHSGRVQGEGFCSAAMVEGLGPRGGDPWKEGPTHTFWQQLASRQKSA